MVDIIRRGSKLEYYKDGVLHREDGPAVIYDNGINYWYKFGKIHREDGPAVDWTNGEYSWYRNGLYHREDGPAIVWDEECSWYVNGVKSTTNRPFLRLLLDFKMNLTRARNIYLYDEIEQKQLERLV